MRPNAMTPAGMSATAKRPSSNAGSSGTARATRPRAAGTTVPRTPEDRAARTPTSGNVGHRRKLRLSPAPRAPRRVSGLVRGRERDRAASERAATSVREHGKIAASERRATSVREHSRIALGERAGSFLRSLPDHMLVDRLVRGRAWIWVLGVMLAGIVAMQVEVLKLGASIGRSMQRTSVLTTRNELLRASVASLGDDQRIERLAEGMGMIMPAPDAVGFLSATRGGDVQQAIANVHAPDAAAFLASHDKNGAVATISTLSPLTGSISVTAPSTSSTSGTTASAGMSTNPSTGTTGSASVGSGSTSGSSAGISSPQSAPTQAAPSQSAQSQSAPSQTSVTQTSPVQTAPVQPAAAQTTPGQGGTSPQTGGAGAAALQPGAPAQTQTGGSGGG